MVQVAFGAADFDATGDGKNGNGIPPSASECLRPWLVFVEQVMLPGELQAVQNAVNALTWEWNAAQYCRHGLQWVQLGNADLAMRTFQSAFEHVRMASELWGQAAMWLRDYGDRSKAAWYQPLYGHVLEQQRRLSELVERWWATIGRVCQVWGMALPTDLR